MQWNHGGIMVESWWNHGVESHLRRSFCDSTMIPLQIYDSTKTTIIPLVELWWNYRGGITKIVSERRGGAVSYSEEQQQQASAMHHRPYTQQHTPHDQYWQQQLQASADSLAQQQGGPAEGLVQWLPPPPASGAR